MITAATLMKSTFVKKFATDAVKLGYSQLLKMNDIYIFLAKYKVVKATDSHHKLYMHTVVLFAALGKPVEYIELLMLKSVSDAFKMEKLHGETGAFALQLDAELHTNSLVRKIKHWDNIPQEDVNHFFSICERLMKEIAPASAISILNGQQSLQQDLDKLSSGQVTMEQNIIASIKQMGWESSNDVLLKEYETQINELTLEVEQGHASPIFFWIKRN